MDLVEYKNLEWHVINEDDKSKLLLLKDCLSDERIQKYFKNKEIIDKNFNVKFNNDPLLYWWGDSPIRDGLKTGFLLDLDENDLNPMTTVIKLGEDKQEYSDLVRVLTIEEVKKLPKEVLRVDNRDEYWTMNPYATTINGPMCIYCMRSFTRDIRNFDLLGSYVNWFSGIRPVISLKKGREFIKEDVEEEFRKTLSI